MSYHASSRSDSSSFRTQNSYLHVSAPLTVPSESPRWLTEQGKIEAANKSLRWLRASDEIANAEMVEIETTMATEKALHDGLSVWDMFRNPVDRRRTIVSIAAINTQAASG